MDNLEQQLSSVLENPEMMQKIMAMAQSLGSTPVSTETNTSQPPQSSMPNIDPGMIQKLSGILGSTNIDREQRALLSALSPYLSQSRIQKLENAMRASHLAGFAAKVLQQNGR